MLGYAHLDEDKNTIHERKNSIALQGPFLFFEAF